MRSLILAAALAVTASLCPLTAHAAAPDAGAFVDDMQAPQFAPAAHVVTSPPAASPASQAPQSQPVGAVVNAAAIASLLVLFCAFLTALVKVVAPRLHLFQTAWGSLVLAIVSGAITGLGTAAAASGLAWLPLAAAAIAGATSALAGWRPGAEKVPPVIGMLLPFLLVGSLGAALAGCAYCNTAANVATPRCQLQQGTLDCAQLAKSDILTLANATDIVDALIGNGANYVADLLELAAKAAPGAWEFITCEAAAVKAYFVAALAQPASSAAKEMAPRVIARVDALLAIHPRAIVNVPKLPLDEPVRASVARGLVGGAR